MKKKLIVISCAFATFFTACNEAELENFRNEETKSVLLSDNSDTIRAETLTAIINKYGDKIISVQKNVTPTLTTFNAPMENQEEIAFPHKTKDIVTFITGETIHIIDSFYVYQGDILLNEEQLSLLTEPDTPEGTDETVNLRGNLLNYSKYKWTDNTIYWTNGINDAQTIQYIQEAIAEWEVACPFLKFVWKDRNMNPKDYIVFMRDSDGSSYSYVGRQGGAQNISIATWGNKGTVLHEIGHALGLLHEHSRKDRDNYITVHYNNIISNKRSDYDKTSSKLNTVTVHGLSMPGGYPSIGGFNQFDYNSIMLYYSYSSNAINKSDPVITKLNEDTYTAQRSYIGSIDRLTIFYLYGISPIDF